MSFARDAEEAGWEELVEELVHVDEQVEVVAVVEAVSLRVRARGSRGKDSIL